MPSRPISIKCTDDTSHKEISYTIKFPFYYLKDTYSDGTKEERRLYQKLIFFRNETTNIERIRELLIALALATHKSMED